MSSVDLLDEFQSDSLFGGYPDVDDRTCQLLGPTALVVQAMMGVLVVLSLLYKRHREKPKRPWKIWLFDVSKQVVGQAFVHGVNVLISDLAAHHAARNPCVMYFLNILIDTTFGVAVIYFLLRIITHILSTYFHLKGFLSGEYGDPPSLLYWLLQSSVYVCALTTMKLLVVGLFAVWPGLIRIGAWLLSWTGRSNTVQVIIVMGLFPIIMNILQFWLIDSIVKASSHSLDASAEEASDDVDREPLFNDQDSDDDDPAARPIIYDIENPQPKRYSRSHSRESTDTLNHDETKYASSSGAPSTPADATGQAACHAYPPSSSPESSKVISLGPTSTQIIPIKRPGKRTPPPPLRLSSSLSSSSFSSAVIAVGTTPMSTTTSPMVITPVGSPLMNEKGAVRHRSSWDLSRSRPNWTL